ncbi:bacterio-opsin activator domain-containing protein [Haloglomus litoreum]|uniref:bacterio-opsin activator domain-containing protein n=1 Tax=Haloglomus litoreum TaxID=3034026 RepID=UPI0023E886BC|nr:bacterio-opsin activator domain-containing protein [Haloglomus sp. DT116]
MSSEGQANRVEIDRGRYRQLLGAAGTDRERLVLRLAGEVGLTPTEMTRLEAGHAETRLHDGGVSHALRVPDGDGGTDRLAPLPADLESALTAYVGPTAEPDAPVFEVTARRLQMLVGSVTDRAAEAAADPALERVSTADLRRFFGRDAVERGVAPGAVLAAGGWDRLDSIGAGVSDPDGEAAVSAFANASPPVVPDDAPATETVGEAAGPDPRALRDALDRLDAAVVVLGPSGRIRHANRSFERLTGRRVDGVVGRSFDSLVLDDALPGEFWRAVATEGAWSGVLPYASAEDGARERWTRASRVPDGTGGAERVVVEIRQQGTSPAAGRAKAVAASARAVGERLLDELTRDGVLAAATEVLARGDAYACAWVVDPSPPQGLEPLAAAGVEPSVAAEYAAGDADLAEAARTVAETGTVRTITVDPVSAAPDAPSLLLAPLRHAESVHGVLVLAAPGAADIEDREREVVADLGRRVGLALSAAEWRHLLLSDTVLELTFESTDPDSLFVDASDRHGCRIELDGMVPVEEGLLYYVTVSGAAPEDALGTAREAGEARLVADRGDAALLEVAAPNASLATPLVERGGNVRSLVAEDGRAELVCEFSPDAAVRDLLDAFREAFPESNLLAKREEDRPTASSSSLRAADDELTDKQRSVLRAAYHAGYFEWPRGSTAEELADSMDISSPTLHNHLRRAQQRLLTALFEGESRPLAEETVSWDS